MHDMPDVSPLVTLQSPLSYVPISHIPDTCDAANIISAKLVQNATRSLISPQSSNQATTATPATNASPAPPLTSTSLMSDASFISNSVAGDAATCASKLTVVATNGTASVTNNDAATSSVATLQSTTTEPTIAPVPIVVAAANSVSVVPTSMATLPTPTFLKTEALRVAQLPRVVLENNADAMHVVTLQSGSAHAASLGTICDGDSVSPIIAELQSSTSLFKKRKRSPDHTVTRQLHDENTMLASTSSAIASKRQTIDASTSIMMSTTTCGDNGNDVASSAANNAREENLEARDCSVFVVTKRVDHNTNGEHANTTRLTQPNKCNASSPDSSPSNIRTIDGQQLTFKIEVIKKKEKEKEEEEEEEKTESGDLKEIDRKKKATNICKSERGENLTMATATPATAAVSVATNCNKEGGNAHDDKDPDDGNKNDFFTSSAPPPPFVPQQLSLSTFFALDVLQEPSLPFLSIPSSSSSVSFPSPSLPSSSLSTSSISPSSASLAAGLYSLQHQSHATASQTSLTSPLRHFESHGGRSTSTIVDAVLPSKLDWTSNVLEADAFDFLV